MKNNKYSLERVLNRISADNIEIDQPKELTYTSFERDGISFSFTTTKSINFVVTIVFNESATDTEISRNLRWLADRFDS